ncbi:MAG: hypothetical protein ACFCAD_17360 [Pleurocapsa sp.]
MNRKGKKASPTTAKKIKANRSNSPSDKHRNLSKSKNKGTAVAKKKGQSSNRKPILNTLANNNSRLKGKVNPAAKKILRANLVLRSKANRILKLQNQNSLFWLQYMRSQSL